MTQNAEAKSEGARACDYRHCRTRRHATTQGSVAALLVRAAPELLGFFDVVALGIDVDDLGADG